MTDAVEQELVKQKLAVDSSTLEAAWKRDVAETVARATLRLPADGRNPPLHFRERAKHRRLKERHAALVRHLGRDEHDVPQEHGDKQIAGALPDIDFSALPDASEWGSPHDLTLGEVTTNGLPLQITGPDPYFFGPARDYPARSEEHTSELRHMSESRMPSSA